MQNIGDIVFAYVQAYHKVTLIKNASWNRDIVRVLVISSDRYA